MDGYRNYVRTHYYSFLCSLIIVSCLFCSACRASDSNPNVQNAIGELQVRGKQFRAEVEATFLKMSKTNAQRTYDLIDVCNRYFPVGTSFPDVEIILVAAGTRTAKSGGLILVPNYNRRLPVGSPDRNDVGSGFLLEKSWISNSIFEITFRPQDANAAPKKIGEIIGCFVRSTSL